MIRGLIRGSKALVSTSVLQGIVQSRDESCAPRGEPGPVPAGYSGAWLCTGYCHAKAAQD